MLQLWNFSFILKKKKENSKALLMLRILGKNSAEYILKYSLFLFLLLLLLFFSENSLLHFMQIFSSGANLLEMSEPVLFCEQKKRSQSSVGCLLKVKVN